MQPSNNNLVKIIESKKHVKKHSAKWNWHILLVLFTLEFALGFGLCYWWWYQWELNQPKIFLKPNDRGIFISPESLRSFYDDIKEGISIKQVESKWKAYETKFIQVGSFVETQIDVSENNFLIRVDDWVIHVKFKHDKIIEKTLILFFEDQLSVFKTMDNDNRIRAYILDSTYFVDKTAKNHTEPPKLKQNENPHQPPKTKTK
jgi:hypothetical protein